MFSSWISERNQHFSEESCPEDLLLQDDPVILNKWLCLFIMEVRKADGSFYPPSSIHLILCGLQRHIRCKNKAPINFFDKNDVRFRGLRGTMESVFQRLHQKGVGCDVKHTAVFTESEENALWEAGVLGEDSPNALIRFVFFLNGKNMCLRGGQEHQDLRLMQFTRERDH